MPMPLTGQVALVTGASSGIGRAVALHLADIGAHVAVNYRENAEAGRAVVEEIRRYGRKAVAIGADVTVREQVEGMMNAAHEALGPISILINNVGGLGATTPFEAVDEAMFDRIMALNLKSAFFCTQAALGDLTASGDGRVVNVSSIAAETGGPGGCLIYAAAKGALNTLTVGLARELGPRGVRVNAVAPGLIDTPFHVGHERSFGSRIAAIPLGRMGEAAEVARLVGLLVSDRTRFVTGQVWTVAGGR